MSKVLKASSVLGEISEDAQRSSEFVSFLGSDQQKVDAFQAWKSAVGDDRKEHEQALLKSLTDFLKKEAAVPDMLLSPRVGAAISSDQDSGQRIFKNGTFEECFLWITEKGPSTKFLQEATFFLFGYRSFATANELFDLVALASEKKVSNARLWDFVHVWVKILSEKDSSLLQKLLTLQGMPQNVSNDIKLMLLRKSKKVSTAELAVDSNAGSGFGNLMPAEWTAQQIAEALTMAEASVFYDVSVEEFLDNAFADDNRAVKAPHLSKLAARFNSVSFWTASQILLRGGDSSKLRAQEIERFISLMEHLRSINNFDGVMSVMAGLNNAAISRLKEDWALVSNEKMSSFRAIEKLLDPSRNFRNYRDEIGKLSSNSKPVLPYVSVHLRDILFIELGNPKREEVVDFEKVLLFGGALSKLCYFQRHRYSFVIDPEIARYFSDLPHLDDDQLHARSLEFRSVDANQKPSIGDKKPTIGDKSPRSMKSLLSPRSNANGSYDDLQKKVNPIFALSSENLAKPANKSTEPLIAPEPEEPAKPPAPEVKVAEVTAAVPEVLADDLSPSKQAMTRDGQFLVIPKTEQESTACAARSGSGAAGLARLAQQCDERSLVMPTTQILRFFVVNHMNEKKALKHVVEYWTYYKSIGYRNIVTVDVSSALSSMIIVPPCDKMAVDLEGRPYILMRANLWFDGDTSNPSVGDLCRLLMWITEDMARSVQIHYTGFTFVMDMKDWTKRNFSTQVYSQLMHMIQSVVPVRCERFIFLDVPKIFSASWKLVSSSLRPEFKKIMIISNREDCAERLIDKASLPPDLGGTYVVPDINSIVQQRKKKEQSVIVSPPSKEPVLTPVPDSVLSDAESEPIPGVYLLKISAPRSRSNSSQSGNNYNSSNNAPPKEKEKTLLSKNSSKLGFFGRKKEDK